MVDFLANFDPPLHCDASEDNKQQLRASHFWNEYCLMAGDLVAVSSGQNQKGFAADDGIALCELVNISNATYGGRARPGIGGSANSGMQAGSQTFTENKFFLRLKVLRVWTKGEGCPLQKNGDALTVATNQNAAPGSELRDTIWKLLTKEERKDIAERIEQREADIAKSGPIEAIPKYRAAARRRDIPLYTAASVKVSALIVSITKTKTSTTRKLELRGMQLE